MKESPQGQVSELTGDDLSLTRDTSGLVFGMVYVGVPPSRRSSKHLKQRRVDFLLGVCGYLSSRNLKTQVSLFPMGGWGGGIKMCQLTVDMNLTEQKILQCKQGWVFLGDVCGCLTTQEGWFLLVTIHR